MNVSSSTALDSGCVPPPQAVKTCLVLPVYNEVQQLERSVLLIGAASEDWAHLDLELVIADNGSTDGTGEVADQLSGRFPRVRHERLHEKGRGRALRRTWMNSRADIVAYMDVDLSTDLSFFPRLIEPLARGDADLAVGSRLLRPDWTERGWKRQFISVCYNRLLRTVFGPSFSDAQCGFKAMTKNAAQALLPCVEDNEWFFDTELLLLADRQGYRIRDLAVRWRDDSDSRVKIVRTIFQDLKGIMRMRRKLREAAPEHRRAKDVGRFATPEASQSESTGVVK